MCFCEVLVACVDVICMCALSLSLWEAALEAPSWRPEGGREVFLLPGTGVCLVISSLVFGGGGVEKGKVR